MRSLLFSLLLVPALAAAQQPEPLQSCTAPAVRDSAVVRTSVYVTMPDGVRLAADVYLPAARGADRLPTILVSTRYWRAAQGQGLGPNEKFWISRGYAFVYADVRGTGASFGQWYYPWSAQEVEDLGNLVRWIAGQPWSDGQVGSIGTSYTGNTAQLVAASNVPAVKAVVPRFMDFDAYADLTYPGGVTNEMLIRDWGTMVHAMDMNKVPQAPNGVRRVDADSSGALIAAAVRDHQGNPPLNTSMTGIVFRDEVVPAFGGATNDQYGTYRYREPIERSGVPIFGWASWLDAGTSQGALNRFLNWSNPQILVIGPWSHGGGFHTSPFRPANTPTEPTSAAQTEQAACFFDQYLKARSAGMTGKRLIYYTLGEERWKEAAAWPIPGTTQERLWFNAGGTLTRRRAPRPGRDRYQVDFDLTTGTDNRWATQLGGQDVVYPERSAADARMLTYTTPALDRDLEVTGQAVVTLTVVSSATDGNFFVYLEDVGPDGKSTYVTEGMLRAIHRKVSTAVPPYRTTYPYHTFGQADATPLRPGEPATLTFQLLPTSVLFRAGHRIRLAIAGADKDTFIRVPAAGDVAIAVQHGGPRGSFIDLPVVPRP
ncbi:MAG: CocE/NonD family hydrolase [Gemmatimonadales bacterium]